MTETIRREIVVPKPPDDVWVALTDTTLLSEWMFPNDFEPRVGHTFTFRMPSNPEVGFDGVVNCEVLECAPPTRLVFTWAGGPVADTQVSYRLEPDGDGTRLFFEHSGFDTSQPWSPQAIKGAEYGWDKMLAALTDVVAAKQKGA